MDERRASDPLLIEIKTKLIDHIDRYERDWKHTREWRMVINDNQTSLKSLLDNRTTLLNQLEIQQADIIRRLGVHCDFIKEVSPVYKRLCWVLGTVAVVSLGIFTKIFWVHLLK